MNDNILLARTEKSERPRICKMFLLHQQKGKREREREREGERGIVTQKVTFYILFGKVFILL